MRHGILVAAILLASAPARADDPATDAADCRAGATRAREIAQQCRDDLAANPDSTCTVDTPTSSLSIDQAESLANDWDAHAASLDPLADELAELEERKEEIETSIENLGFDGRAEDFVEFERESDELRGEAIKTTLEALWDAGGGFIGGALEGTAHMNRAEARAIAKQAEALGIDNPDFLAALRKLNKVKSYKKRLEAAGEVLEKAEHAKDLILMEADTGGWDKAVEHLITLAGWFKPVNNPLVKVTVADYKLLASLLEGHLTENAIDGVTQLTEGDLATLRDRRDDLVRIQTRINEIPGEVTPCMLP